MRTNYTAFGLQQKGIGLTAALPNQQNKYLFNEGTELQTDFDIDLYATDYRSLDPQLGRFWQIDDDAESTEDLSPFNYAANNPILINDPMGLDTLINTGQTAKSDGSIIYEGENKTQDVVVSAKAKSSSNSSGMGATMSLAAATIAAGGGPEDPAGDIVALAEIINGFNTAMDLARMAREIQQEQQLLRTINSSPMYQPTWLKSQSTGTASKGSLSGTKKALKEAKNKIGLKDNETLPKGKQGKFGSPQRGDSKRGYRLDPPHPNAAKGSGEEFPHINYWDYRNGKRGNGGISGAVPIKK